MKALVKHNPYIGKFKVIWPFKGTTVVKDEDAIIVDSLSEAWDVAHGVAKAAIKHEGSTPENTRPVVIQRYSTVKGTWLAQGTALGVRTVRHSA